MFSYVVVSIIIFSFIGIGLLLLIGSRNDLGLEQVVKCEKAIVILSGILLIASLVYIIVMV